MYGSAGLGRRPNGFWTGLESLEPPAMFIWGDEDPLVPLAFSHHVAEALAEARESHRARAVARIERAHRRLRGDRPLQATG